MYLFCATNVSQFAPNFIVLIISVSRWIPWLIEMSLPASSAMIDFEYFGESVVVLSRNVKSPRLTPDSRSSHGVILPFRKSTKRLMTSVSYRVTATSSSVGYRNGR